MTGKDAHSGALIISWFYFQKKRNTSDFKKARKCMHGVEEGGPVT